MWRRSISRLGKLRRASEFDSGSFRSSTTGALRKNRGLRWICSASSNSKVGSRSMPARTTMTVNTAPCTRLPAIREPPPPLEALQVDGLTPNRAPRNGFRRSRPMTPDGPLQMSPFAGIATPGRRP